MINGTAFGIWNESAMQTVNRVLAEGVKAGATVEAKRAASKIPGYLLLAGAGIATIGGVILSDRLEDRMNKPAGARTFGDRPGTGPYGPVSEVYESRARTRTGGEQTEGTEGTQTPDNTTPTDEVLPAPPARAEETPAGKDPAEMTKEEATAEKTKLDESLGKRKEKMKLSEFMSEEEVGVLEDETKIIDSSEEEDEIKIARVALAIRKAQKDEPRERQWNFEQADNFILYVIERARLEKVNSKLAELEKPAPTDEIHEEPPEPTGESTADGDHLEDDLRENVEARRAGATAEEARAAQEARRAGREAARVEAAAVLPEAIDPASRGGKQLIGLFVGAVVRGKSAGYGKESWGAKYLSEMLTKAGYEFAVGENQTTQTQYLYRVRKKEAVDDKALRKAAQGLRDATDGVRRTPAPAPETTTTPEPEQTGSLTAEEVLEASDNAELTGAAANSAIEQIAALVNDGTAFKVRPTSTSKIPFVTQRLEALRSRIAGMGYEIVRDDESDPKGIVFARREKPPATEGDNLSELPEGV